MTAAADIKTAQFFHLTSQCRVSDMTAIANIILGRNARNNSEIIGALSRYIDNGLLIVVSQLTAIKGCPGGRARPGAVDIKVAVRTEAGRAHFAKINAEQDAIKAAAELPRRLELMAEMDRLMAVAADADKAVAVRRMPSNSARWTLAQIEEVNSCLVARATHRATEADAARLTLISTRIAEDLRSLGTVSDRALENIAGYYATTIDHVRGIYSAQRAA